MTTAGSQDRPFRVLAIVGAGTMGSGLAQKIAAEGFQVVLLDLDNAIVRERIEKIRLALNEGVERRIYRPEQVQDILARITGSCDWNALAEADLVIEAVFEDLDVKNRVFQRLEAVCRDDAILATNTSSFSVTDLASVMRHPGRMVGLHYFFHPAKNRLVEVVPGKKTDPRVLDRSWALQELIGKTPIASADSYGFIVNRYFVPWLNEAVRVAEEKLADIPTIEAAAKETFGVGMGPFELMNVSGIPIALHSANTLKEAFDAFYAPAGLLQRQVASGDHWDLAGQPDPAKFDAIKVRMLGTVFYVASQLVDEGVGSIDDVDVGARVGLRWPAGPFELANKIGIQRASQMARRIAETWDLRLPRTLSDRTGSDRPFEFKLVRTKIRDGIATLTIYRPDAMNALNEAVVSQLDAAFSSVEADETVDGIVIAGSGKAFIAGADIRFFLENINNDDVDRTVEFSRRGQRLLRRMELCAKPVVARVHGLALGGGLELALACDYIVASEKASLAFPETGIGICPGLGGTQRTTRRVGPGLAKYLVLTGKTMSAGEAEAIGLIDRSVPAEELDVAVRAALEQGVVTDRSPAAVPEHYRLTADFFERADVDALLVNNHSGPNDPVLADAVNRVQKKAPIAVRLAFQLIDRGVAMPIENALQLELDHVAEIFATRDAYEGLTSVGRAKPRFEGH